MPNFKDDIYIASLLAKSIADKTLLNIKELKYINDWLSQSEHNRELYLRIKQGNIAYERENILKLFNIKSDWAKVKKIIQKEPLTVRKISLNILKYAAVLLIPVTIAVSIFYFAQWTDGSNDFSAITPGKATAILTLYDGKKILLENTDTLIHELNSQTDIVVDSSQIAYVSNNQSLDQKLQYNTLSVPRKGEYFIILSDGTKVWTNSESSLKYPVSFSGPTREVYLSGEAFFEVSKNKDKPFIVKTSNAIIKVLGTSFNIKAYEDEPATYTTVEEGEVQVSANQMINNLKANQQVKITSVSNELVIKKVDALLFTSWRKGKFKFKDERLEDILNTLARWYNIELSFTNEDIKNIRFSCNIDRYESIRPIIEIVEATEKVKFKINLNHVKVIAID